MGPAPNKTPGHGVPSKLPGRQHFPRAFRVWLEGLDTSCLNTWAGTLASSWLVSPGHHPSRLPCAASALYHFAVINLTCKRSYADTCGSR